MEGVEGLTFLKQRPPAPSQRQLQCPGTSTEHLQQAQVKPLPRCVMVQLLLLPFFSSVELKQSSSSKPCCLTLLVSDYLLDSTLSLISQPPLQSKACLCGGATLNDQHTCPQYQLGTLCIEVNLVLVVFFC